MKLICAVSETGCGDMESELVKGYYTEGQNAALP